MCIYRLSVSVIGRTSTRRSAVETAAYRAGVSLVNLCDYGTGAAKAHDYGHRRGVVASGVFLPDNALCALRNRETLWNAAERAEKRKNSRTAREALIALPHELDDMQRKRLTEAFARHLVNRYGVAADYAIHRPDMDGDQRNHHAHILFTTRVATAVGLAEKTRILDDRHKGGAEIESMRMVWEGLCNEALAQAKLKQRVDRRSNAARGVARLPEPKQGAQGTERVRSGKQSYAARERMAVRAYNAAVRRCKGDRGAMQVKRDGEALRRIRRGNMDAAQWLLLKAARMLRAYGNDREGRLLCREWNRAEAVNIYRDFGRWNGVDYAIGSDGYAGYRLE